MTKYQIYINFGAELLMRCLCIRKNMPRFETDIKSVRRVSMKTYQPILYPKWQFVMSTMQLKLFILYKIFHLIITNVYMGMKNNLKHKNNVLLWSGSFVKNWFWFKSKNISRKIYFSIWNRRGHVTVEQIILYVYSCKFCGKGICNGGSPVLYIPVPIWKREWSILSPTGKYIKIPEAYMDWSLLDQKLWSSAGPCWPLDWQPDITSDVVLLNEIRYIITRLYHIFANIPLINIRLVPNKSSESLISYYILRMAYQYLSESPEPAEIFWKLWPNTKKQK